MTIRFPRATAHVDQIRGAMAYARGLAPGARIVQVIDREADSVGHWRDWTADGHLALVRGDDRKIRHDGRERWLSEVADRLRDGRTFRDAGEVLYRGRRAWMYVAETPSVLHQPARRHVGGGKQVTIAGPPLALRLVVGVTGGHPDTPSVPGVLNACRRLRRGHRNRPRTRAP